MSILGNAVQRVEDPRLLTVGGTYVADVVLDGTAYVTFVRSTMAHARINELDTTEAAAMPGVLACVTASELALPDVAPFVMCPPEFTRPPLASQVVRFVGDPVVAVLTETPEQGVDAAEAVFVDYEPLPVVLDPKVAVEGEIVLHEAAGSNVALAMPPRNTIDTSDCQVTVTAEIVNSRVFAAPIEPRVASAYWADDGRLVCHSSTQGAHPARDAIAAVLGIDTDQVRVVIPDVGGGFGAKGSPGVEECILGRLAQLVDRPVTWIETRSEDMVALGHGRDQIQEITLGGTRDGDITHYRLDVLADCGAYAEIGTALPMFTGLMAPGVYDIANIEFSAKAVLTNKSPAVAFRGAGRPEATAAIERGIDLFAAEVGMDPAELRRRNFIAADAFPFSTPTGAAYDSGDYPASLDLALEAVGYDDLRAEQQRRRTEGGARQLGIGLSTYVEITAPVGAPNITEFGSVELLDDGSILARTGSTPYGQGHVTTWSMVIADTLGVPMDRITIVHGDTDEIPTSNVTGGSRSAQVAGSSLFDASNRLADAARKVAADLLEAAEADVVLDAEAGAFHVTGTPAVTVGWDQVAAAVDEPMSFEGEFVQASPTFPFGTHAAVVEVDIETGAVELTRLVAVDDAGTLLNPLLAQGQIHGGLAAGAAQALLEEIRYDDDGNLLTSNFADYGVISTMELPSFELVGMQTASPHNPLGAKGIGESGTVGSTPAVQNAVVDALAPYGVRHLDMPATSEKVWAAINRAARS